MILPLIQNVALLVALSALYRALVMRFRYRTLGYHVALGLMFGGAGVIGMMTPMNLQPGIIFDGRTIVMSVAGLFGGPITALIGAVICSAYRLWLGGGGAWVGVSTIIEAAALGTIFYYLRRRSNAIIPLSWMWTLGLVVTLVQLTLFLGLPQGAGITVIRDVGVVILIMYPAATALVCSLLQDADLQMHDREVLRAREAALQKAQDLAQLGQWKWHIPQNRLELSEQTQRIFEIEAGDYPEDLDEAVAALVHPDDQEVFAQLKRLAIDEKRMQAPIEFRMQLPDGTERVVWAEAGEMFVDSGRPQWVAGILQDITARRDAEEKARASENRYRNLFLNSPDAIIVNHRGRVSMVNQACVKLFGAENADELIGKNVFDLFHPDYHPQIAERIHRLQDLGETVPLAEEKIVRLDGSVVDVDVIAAPFVTQSGNDVHVIIRDITERKKMEAALRESHEMLAGIAEQAPGVVYQYRLFPDGRSCFPYASQGIMEIYEVAPEDVREDATAVFGRLNPDDRERITAEIMESGRLLTFFHTEFRVILPRQGHRWRLCNATPQRMADGGTLWYGIIMDITDRKLAEQQITEQLDELRRWRTVMLGREKRNIELKKEVNELRRLAGRPPRYTGIE